MMFRPLLGATIATAIAIAILLGLGTWQVIRRGEKHELLAQLQSRRSQEPVSIEMLIPVGDYAAFRPVTAMGAFLHESEVYVAHARTDRGPTEPGFKVLTPFKLSGGDFVVVDRGWIPQAKRDPTTRAKGQTPDAIEIEGAMRRSARPTMFTPPPGKAGKIIYVRDVAAVSALTGLNFRTQMLIEAKSRAEDGPEPIETGLDIPDNHLGYAVTWYALAIALLAIYARYHYVQGRLRLRR